MLMISHLHGSIYKTLFCKGNKQRQLGITELFFFAQTGLPAA